MERRYIVVRESNVVLQGRVDVVVSPRINQIAFLFVVNFDYILHYLQNFVICVVKNVAYFVIHHLQIFELRCFGH